MMTICHADPGILSRCRESSRSELLAEIPHMDRPAVDSIGRFVATGG